MNRLDQVRQTAKAREEGFQEGRPSAVKVGKARPATAGLGQADMPNPSTDGGNFLRHFMDAHPFMDLFEYGAGRFTPHKNIRLQNLNYRLLHPRLYQGCVRTDFALRIIVVVALAVRAAIKVLQ